MAQLVMFLLGIITSATTSIGEKTNAALRMVGLGHESEIPPAYRYLVQPDGKTVAVPTTTGPAETTDHGFVGNWLHAMASDHPILLMVLAAALGFYVLYKVRSVAAVFTRGGRGARS